jgi:hypothetical protein
MNTERLGHLLCRYFDGAITAEEIAELDAALKTRPEARDAFLKEAHLHGALREWGIENRGLLELRAIPQPTDKKFDQGRRPPRPLWHPLTAAAAGVVFGLFCASAAWGVASTRAAVTASRVFALIDGSFESRTAPLPSGFPVDFGVWSGDASETIERRFGGEKEGRRVLRFLRAEKEPVLVGFRAASCDVYQLVDLRAIKAQNRSGKATLELSAQFLDSRASVGAPVLFLGRVYAFTGSPDEFADQWPLPQKAALAAGWNSFESRGGTPSVWHPVSAQLSLPPQADFAVVQVVAHIPNLPQGASATFGEHFVDDVQLTLKTPPALQTRLMSH